MKPVAPVTRTEVPAIPSARSITFTKIGSGHTKGAEPLIPGQRVDTQNRVSPEFVRKQAKRAGFEYGPATARRASQCPLYVQSSLDLVPTLRER